MLDEKVANLIPIHESSETKYLQFGLQQYATLASRHILYVENYVAKCLSVWYFLQQYVANFFKAGTSETELRMQAREVQIGWESKQEKRRD